MNPYITKFKKELNEIISNWKIADQIILLHNLIKNCVVEDFTTRRLSKQTSFNTKTECEKEQLTIYNTPTNPTYPNFTQAIFHAGDVQQFKKYATFKTPLLSKSSKKDKDKNNWKLSNMRTRRLSINDMTIDRTFHYMFDLFKKGICVQIFNNSIHVFLPFSKYNYINNWYEQLKAPSGKDGKRGKSLWKLETEKNKKKDVYIEKDLSKWYANNCFFRNTVKKIKGEDKNVLYFDEGDKSVANFLELISYTCVHHKVPNVVFFINPRDVPILTNSGKHPYSALWAPKNEAPEIPEAKEMLEGSGSGVEKEEKGYVPILSQCTGSGYLDIPIPTDDDIINFLKVYTIPGCKSPAIFNEGPKWSFKKDTAVFRGSATGCGITIESNKRLQICYMSYLADFLLDSKEKGKGVLLDCKLTSYNSRLKKDPRLEYCDYLTPDTLVNGSFIHKDVLSKLGISSRIVTRITEDKKVKELGSKKDRLGDEQQQEYKYIIDVEGHSSAFRLSRVLGWGSLVLKVDSQWELWFEKKLSGTYYDNITEEMVNNNRIHYIKIRVNEGIIDFENLIDTIRWCRNNDKMAQRIAENSRNFYFEYLNKKGVLDYMKEVLDQIAI